MSELKTKQTEESVLDFLNSVQNDQRREDALELLTIFKETLDMEPRMWGSSIVGYGKYHYKSERSKQEGDWPLTAFSPRKQNLTVYIMTGFDKFSEELKLLGKHKTSVSCLYINKLADINIKILKQIISKSVEMMKKIYKVHE